MRVALALALALGACAPALAPAPAAAPARAPAVEGEVSLAPGTPPTKGRLVLAWRTPAEDAEERAGHGTMAAARAMLERWTAAESVDFAATPRVHFRLTGAPPDAVPVIMLDVERTFWATMFGGGRGLLGAAEPGTRNVVLAPNRPRPTAETCTGDRMKLVIVHAPEVAGTIGNDVDRRFCAWLPPSYASSPQRRYPVVFFFGGLMSTDRRFSGPSHPGTLADRIAKDTGREVIVIAADMSTKSGSSYLEDSPLTGQWDTFFAKNAVPAIDAALRTLPRRTARALTGHSTGGHEALSYGMRRSDLFGAIGASSPDAPDIEAWLFRPGTRVPEPWLVTLIRLEHALGGPGQMTSYGADWSPDGSPRGFAWPFDVQTGQPVPAVVAKWAAKSPLGVLQDPAALARITKDLGNRILITVGDKDEFGLFAPAQAFSSRLASAGVEHTFHVTQGGHVTNVEKQLDDAMRFIVAKLDPATP